jgi:hypothetical protein
MIKIMTPSSLWSPLPISRLNREGQRELNVQAMHSCTRQSLCTVVKPFGEDHKGRTLSFPHYWIKLQALTASTANLNCLPDPSRYNSAFLIKSLFTIKKNRK